MSRIDWILMCSFLLFVALYGIWKARGKKDIKGFLLADRKTPWYTITLSVMATQASAITFLSTRDRPLWTACGLCSSISASP